jgi:hypothetical protein
VGKGFLENYNGFAARGKGVACGAEKINCFVLYLINQ